jgi:type I restriction enzyme S subunit
MPKTRDQVLQLVREFHERLADVYGERLKGVYLYGSYARGKATEDSDIDVAVVLEGPVHAHREEERTGDIVGDLCLREACLLVPFFISDEEYQATPYAVHRNIASEGVPV